MFMNCHILSNTIVQSQQGCKGLSLFVEKTNDLVLDSFTPPFSRLVLQSCLYAPFIRHFCSVCSFVFHQFAV